MTEDRDDELIRTIYETAMDPGLWPLVCEGLSSIVDDASPAPTESSHNDRDPAFSAKEFDPLPADIDENLHYADTQHDQHLYEKIKPHLIRALRIRIRQQGAERGSQALNRLIDNISFGVFVVDRNCRLMYTNTVAEELIADKSLFTLKQGTVRPYNPQADETFRRHIAQISRDDTDNPYAMALDGRRGQNVSLMITRLDLRQHLATRLAGYAMILVTPPLNIHRIPHSQLRSTYQFTPSESRLANELVQGKRLAEIATDRNISINTVRSQLSAIFSKTGTQRQADLIGLLIRSKATAQPTPQSPAKNRWTKNSTRHPLVNHEGIIKLRDNRAMGYAEYGDPDGFPVIYCHSHFGCRYEVHPTDNAPAEHGVRLIVPDRPGFGLSDATRFDKYADWAHDLAQLATYLDIKSFAIAGFGTGGNFALAAAWHLGEKVNSVTVISPILPIPTIEGMRPLASTHRMTMALAIRLPRLAVQIYNVLIKGAAQNPDYFFSEMLAADALEREIFEQPNIQTNLRRCMGEVVARKHPGIAEEIRYIVKPWEFELRKIRQPIQVWRGQLDGHAPIVLAERLLADIPQASIHRIVDEGYMLIYRKWSEIIRKISATGYHSIKYPVSA